MKTWIVALGVAVVLGVAAGIGTAWMRVRLAPWDGTPGGSGSESAKPVVLDLDAPKPKLLLAEDTHDFGAMDERSKGHYEFVFANVGDAPLTLKQGRTSCTCTSTILEKGDIQPGRSGKVAVEWNGKNRVGPFKATATVTTNDPYKPTVTLTITGRITTAVRVVPTRLAMSGITASEEASAQVKVFGFLSEPLEVIGHEFSHPETSENFRVTCEPLSPDQVAEEQDATSGCLVEVTVKPGLPLGAFQQTILLKTNYPEAPTIEVPVEGTISSDISIVGKGWNRSNGTLYWGNVKSQEGARRDLFIRVSGPHRKEVKFKPIEIHPDLLEVKLGETSYVEHGRLSLTTLTIQIPKGSPPADYLGSSEEKLGQIILQTNHPTARELRILLRFSIEG